jgi:hypothetical protein
MAAPEPCERRRHERGERRWKAPEAQTTVAPAGDRTEFLLGAVEPRKDPGRVPSQGVTGLGQLDRAGAALDQRAAASDSTLSPRTSSISGTYRDSRIAIASDAARWDALPAIATEGPIAAVCPTAA